METLGAMVSKGAQKKDCSMQPQISNSLASKNSFIIRISIWHSILFDLLIKADQCYQTYTKKPTMELIVPSVWNR